MTVCHEILLATNLQLLVFDNLQIIVPYPPTIPSSEWNFKAKFDLLPQLNYSPECAFTKNMNSIHTKMTSKKSKQQADLYYCKNFANETSKLTSQAHIIS